MSDGAFPDRLSQLKARWESDPTSRIFIQLAEEYRHQGRVRDALAVLDKGLREHPGYLSALVAKGRCHLELGEAEPARTVLERVVKQDATQMVANKLLVRACLETGDASRARERLDLYTLLNDSDPEIEDLRRQIKQMERSNQRAAAEESPFDLSAPSRPSSPSPPTSPPREEDDIFGLGIGPGAGGGTAAPPPQPAANEAFELDLAPPPAPAVSAALPVPPPAALDETAADDGDLFPGLRSRSSRQRYLSALGAEDIFDLGAEPALASPVAPVHEIPVTAAEAPVDVSWLAEQPAAVDTPVFEFVEPAPAPPTIPEPFAPTPEPEDLWVEETPVAPEPAPQEPAWALEETEVWVAPPADPEPPEATATLGDLYLRQGHTEEAERIFREVLDRDPGHAAARAGLASIEDGRRPAAAPEPVSVPEPASEPVSEPVKPLDAGQLLAGYPAGGGMTARKVYLLNQYLNRLRQGQGSRRDVS